MSLPEYVDGLSTGRFDTTILCHVVKVLLVDINCVILLDRVLHYLIKRAIISNYSINKYTK